MRLLLRTALAVFLATVVFIPTAFADALVVVEVRTPDGAPADGTVTLTPRGEGQSHSCTTRAGRCRIEGVAGGMYRVSFAPTEGEAPPDQPAVIPPEGRVSLHVSAR